MTDREKDIVEKLKKQRDNKPAPPGKCEKEPVGASHSRTHEKPQNRKTLDNILVFTMEERKKRMSLVNFVFSLSTIE